MIQRTNIIPKYIIYKVISTFQSLKSKAFPKYKGYFPTFPLRLPPKKELEMKSTEILFYMTIGRVRIPIYKFSGVIEEVG